MINNSRMRDLPFLLLIMLVVSCQTKTDTSEKGLTIPVREENFVKDTTRLSDLISVAEVIPLETHKDGLIGRMDKVILTNSRIYVLDAWQAKCVFIFDQKGKFINKIKSPGKGPSDLFWPADITVNTATNELLILDPQIKKFNTYDTIGYFIRTTPINFYSDHFEYFGNNRLVFSSEDKYSIFITDLNGTEFHKFLLFEPSFQSVQPRPLINYNSEFYFLRFMDDSIYRVTETTDEPGILIDYGKNSLTREVFLKTPVTGMDRTIDKKYMTGNQYFAINGTHISFYMSYQSKGYLNVYNKSNGHLFTSAVPLIRDDLFNGGANIRSLSNTYKEHFVGKIEPSKIYSLNSPLFKQFKYEFAPDDNPAVLLYDFK